jgi:hypothetical protein
MYPFWVLVKLRGVRYPVDDRSSLKKWWYLKTARHDKKINGSDALFAPLPGLSVPGLARRFLR